MIYESKNIRLGILKLCYRLGTNAAHLGGCLSLADIMHVLYSEFLSFNTDNLMDEYRDRVIMSKGHGSIAMYSAMCEVGLIDNLDCIGDLTGKDNIYYKQEVRFPKKGIEFSSGSLGQGLAYAVGVAWALKRKGNNKSKVYVFVGDGECEEGSVWEAASIASHLKLDNIVVIADKNDLQIDGWTREINSQESMCDRWSSFGFEVIEINGHDYSDIRHALNVDIKQKPITVVAHTVKGKGISFIENNAEWHQNVVTDELYEKALFELGEVY